MIQSIYDEMWQRFELASAHNDYELDSNLLDIASDTRRGITALAYLKQANRSVLDEIMSSTRHFIVRVSDFASLEVTESQDSQPHRSRFVIVAMNRIFSWS